MESRAYSIFREDLRKYVTDRVPGRSFLIAGYRGAGKTALVREAVEQVIDEQFQRLAAAKPDSLRRFQRPLLVKLHGPSLVEETLPRPGAGERRQDFAPETQAKGEAHSALVQITIALYRAVAREIADAVALRAIDLANEPGDDPTRRELATQLRLDLDQSVETAQLRAVWEEFGALGKGMLWPLDFSHDQDQGMREIVAIVTAAQAFQVCSGAVTYSQTKKDVASHERTTQSRIAFDAKDTVDRLITLATGGLLGYAVAGGSGGAVGLLGGLGVSALSKRSRKSERTDDYSFILDRSIQTLERDLPLVIERVRDAGLAPVFLVDELDKLRSGRGGVGVTGLVAKLINRLKHLTTDYGFFCFLTGRDYFDEVTRIVQEQPYPEEHSYFSRRLLITYGPEDFERYLNSWSPRRAKRLIHDSHFNMIDLVRLVDRDRLRIEAGAEPDPLETLLKAGVQIAIETVLRKPRFGSRMAEDEGFRQMALDTAAWIPRLWLRDELVVDLCRPAFARYLYKRRNGHEPSESDPVAALQRIIGPPKFETLFGLLAELIDALSNFETLVSRIPEGQDSTVYEEALASFDRLLAASGRAGSYAFVFAPDGADLTAERPPEELEAELDSAEALLRAFPKIGLELDDLIGAGWPSPLRERDIMDGIRKVRARLREGAEQLDQVRRAFALLRSFRTAVERYRDSLAAVAELVWDVERFLQPDAVGIVHRPRLAARLCDYFGIRLRADAEIPGLRGREEAAILRASVPSSTTTTAGLADWANALSDLKLSKYERLGTTERVARRWNTLLDDFELVPGTGLSRTNLLRLRHTSTTRCWWPRAGCLAACCGLISTRSADRRGAKSR